MKVCNHIGFILEAQLAEGVKASSAKVMVKREKNWPKYATLTEVRKMKKNYMI